MQRTPANAGPPTSHADRPISAAGVLAFAAAIAFVVYQLTVQTSYSPFRASIETDLDLTVFQSGLVSASFFLVYALMQIPAGLLLDRFGPSRLIWAGAVLTGASAWVFSGSNDLVEAMVGRALIGVAAALAFPGAGLVARRGLPPWCFPLAMGLAEASLGVGGAAGTMGAEWLQQQVGWSRAMQWIALASIPVAAFCLLAIRDRTYGPPRGEATSPGAGAANSSAPARESMLRALGAVLAERRVRIGAAIYAGACGVLYGFGTFWNTPLSHAWQWDDAESSRINAALFIGFGLGGPFFGSIGAQFGAGRVLAVSLPLGALSLAFWIFVPIDWGIAFDAVNVGVVGLSVASSVLAFTVACEAVPAHRTGAAIGVVNLSGVASGALLQLVPGVLVPSAADGTLRSLQMANLVFVVVLGLASLAAMLLLRRAGAAAR